MRLIDLEQGSDEWREMRRSKLGASDIAVLMAGSQKEIAALYQEKQGKDKYETNAMRHGREMEAEAVRWFSDRHGIDFARPVAIHDHHEWLMASFDGLNIDVGISLEVKCPMEVPDVLETWKSFKRYWWQVQAQLAVGGHENAVLLAYSPSKQCETIIHRDEDAIAQILAKGEAFFNEHICKKIAPAESVVLREDAEVQELYEAGYSLKQELEEAEEKWKIWKESVEYVAGDQPFFYKGLRVERIAQKPKVDYKKAVAKLLPGVDLSPFETQVKPFWRTTLTLKKEDQVQE